MQQKRATIDQTKLEMKDKIESYKGKARQVKEAEDKLLSEKQQLQRYQDRQGVEIKEKQEKIQQIKEKIIKEEHRYSQIMQGCMDIEIAISERERVLAKIAEETDINNHRVLRE